VVHTPKTAGTTIRETLQAILGRDSVYWVGHDRPAAHWDNADGNEFAKFSVVGGHVSALAFEKICRPKVFMAVVREPVRRAISLFEYIVRGPDKDHPLRGELTGLTILEAVEQSVKFRGEITNWQCALIGGEPTYSSALRSVCEREWLIDSQERLEDLVQKACAKFGWRAPAIITANENRQPDYFQQYNSDAVIGLLSELNEEDYRLYEMLSGRGDSPTRSRREVARSLITNVQSRVGART